MAARQARQQKAMTTMIANKQKMEDSCPRDQSRGRRTKKMHLHQPQPLLHMDECDDPDCIDFEQLQELQKSIDSFTDYTQYERCCDGDHAEGDDCNGITTDCCQGSIALEDGCEECVDDCDECLEEHEFAYANDFDDLLDIGSPVKCDDDCEKCEEECEENGHERRDCPQDHHTSWDSCITTCGICVDPTPLPLLAPEAEMQLYDLNSYMPHIRPCDERCTPPPFFEEVPDLNLPDSTPSFDMALDHWQTFQQAHHCAPDPCLIDHQMNQFQPPQHLDPQFGFSFGCDPTVPGNQYPWQDHDSLPQICNVQAFSSLDLNGIADNVNDFTPVDFSVPEQSTNPGQILNDINAFNSKQMQSKVPPSSAKTFARTDDLKRHVKNSHLAVKGTVTCRWGSACTASFATEAALTGHISKKHLAPLYAAGGQRVRKRKNCPGNAPSLAATSPSSTSKSETSMSLAIPDRIVHIAPFVING
ncbi:hypothetical protein OHC33_003742 [Knufia fluminis]|uniref:Uncharacterized protein n=1 Tax=Knufia fluminis TaxID=191047 RepID=A0AAN8F2C0_9EURO|nr:hypothetical protein OHC33_003742 [Knufia fluminis]